MSEQAVTQDTANHTNAPEQPPEQTKGTSEAQAAPTAKPEQLVDITSLLDEAAAAMSLGQLLHIQNFQLVDAMSAIELMDAKMDTGMNASRIHTLQERLELNNLPLDSTLSVPQILKLMDYLLCSETTYYDGQQLVQTLMSCLYMHDVKVISNPMLLAFAVATIKTCDFMKNLIVRADVYEEEDFIAVTYGFGLCEHILETEMATMLKNAEEKLAQQLKRAKSGTAADAEGTAMVSPLQSDPAKEAQYCEAFLARIRLRKAFYMAHAYLEKRNLDGAKKTITYALAQLPIIENTANLGEAFPENILEHYIARRMPIPTPNRPMTLMTVQATVKYFERILKDLERVCSIYNEDSLWSLRLFLEDFSRNNPPIISRSRLRLFLCSDGKLLFGKTPIPDLAVQSMTSMKVPHNLLQDSNTKVFLDRVGQVLLNVLHLMCFNRARQRRRIPHVFDDMSILQMEADQLDDHFTPPAQAENAAHYFGRWTMDLSISLMTYYLELGFELDLYNTNEYSFCYWYLDYLYGLQHQNQQLMLEHATKDKQQAKQQKKGKPKPKKEKEVVTVTATVPQLAAEARQHMCRGLFRYMCGLHLAGKLSPPTLPFGTPEIRFARRFAAFLKLHQPSPLSYSYYEQTTNFSQYKPQQLYDAAQDSFKASKGHIEKIMHHKTPSPEYYAADLRALAKVAISNSIQLMQLSSGKPEDLTNTPNFDFSTFRSFPVLSLPKKK